MKCSLVCHVAGLKDATVLIVIVIILGFGNDRSDAKDEEGGKNLGTEKQEVVDRVVGHGDQFKMP